MNQCKKVFQKKSMSDKLLTEYLNGALWTTIINFPDFVKKKIRVYAVGWFFWKCKTQGQKKI